MNKSVVGISLLAIGTACTPVKSNDCDTFMETGCDTTTTYTTEVDCDTWDTGGCDSGYTYTTVSQYDGETLIGVDSSLARYPVDGNGDPMDAIYVDCDVESWDYTFYSIGWTTAGTLWIYGAGWQENAHYVGVAASDEYGYWDQLTLNLPVTDPDFDGDGLGDVYGVDGWEYQTNATASEEGSTLFQCGSHSGSLSWLFTIYDLEAQQADCAVWGYNPDAFASDCLDWN